MSLRERIQRAIEETYAEIVELPPVLWLMLTCLALILAASIALGIHP